MHARREGTEQNVECRGKTTTCPDTRRQLYCKRWQMVQHMESFFGSIRAVSHLKGRHN